jgi:hypothetical protein
VKKKTALTLALTFLLSTTTGVMSTGTALANPIGFANLPQHEYPLININRDGNTTPQTELIIRNGTTYKLTANVTDGTIITIECSDIIFDGGGHTTNGPIAVGFGPPGAANVTIRNVEVTPSGISLLSCSYCQITNVKTQYYIDVSMSDHTNISYSTGPIKLGWESEHTQVFRNNITLLLVESGPNVFFENNFLGSNPSLYADSFWDNDLVGNYWAGYNGSDADGDRIGDTPYIIDEKNIDHYPLMQPYIETEQVTLSPKETSQSPPLQSALLAGICTVSIAVVVTGLICYQKKRRAERN